MHFDASPQDNLHSALTVALAGLLVAALGHLWSKIQSRLFKVLFPSAYISSSDPAYEWIEAYLAQDHNAQKQLRSFQLSTADLRQSKIDDDLRSLARRRSKAVDRTLVLDRACATFTGQVVGQMTPLCNKSIRIRYQGKCLWITRKRQSSSHISTKSEQDKEYFKISGSWFQTSAIKDIVIHSHDQFFSRTKNELKVLTFSGKWGFWTDLVTRPSRSISSVFIPSRVKNLLLKDIDDFRSQDTKDWYRAKCIKHTRSYLLHGPPGSGKTSLVTAIASELGLRINVIDPTAPGMDDIKLSNAFRGCRRGQIILIENIDEILPYSPLNERSQKPVNVPPTVADSSDVYEIPDESTSTVILQGLYIALDGICCAEDIVIFATANCVEALDPKLLRPGRFDLLIPFSNATPEQAKALFVHFFSVEDEQKSYIPENEEAVAAQSRLERGMLNDLGNTFAHRVLGLTMDGDDKMHMERERDSSALSVSMASIQGYLLNHKGNPVSAVEMAARVGEGH
ncbi:uncharacterized protein IL334_001941 [Kwoniella shivajii]|uniref:AAA+ ATPase domain-containing protein n=1 Tax=Kwoniella shivajii TaxID=564305 RepID=A0ABZ1CUW6_9TREE|nr:hypothetical protein IL334_001941 [Kwoniella shivajii]